MKNEEIKAKVCRDDDKDNTDKSFQAHIELPCLLRVTPSLIGQIHEPRFPVHVKTSLAVDGQSARAYASYYFGFKHRSEAAR